MNRKVRVAASVLTDAHELYGESRTAHGSPSEYEFVSGPLAAAVFAFRGFDQLSHLVVSAVRSYTVVDPFFGPVVFTAILTTDDVVEIVTFADDPDYWDQVALDPE